MEIRNHTKYDKELLERYNDFYLLDFIKKNFSVIGVTALGFAIYEFIISEWETALIMFGFIIVYLILTVLIQRLTSRAQLKKSPLVNNPFTRSYVFEDERIVITANGKTSEMKYFELFKTQVSYKYHLFLLIDVNRRPSVVDLQKFENSQDWETLKTFLNGKLKRKIK
jgi:hypothetical protein